MLNPYIKAISVISGVLGCVQAAAWCSLCMVQFVYYSEIAKGPLYEENPSYKNILSNIIYDMLVRKDAEILQFNRQYNIYINGNVALTLAITYFLFSILWLFTSTILIKIAVGHSLHKNGWILIFWTFITLLISFVDVAATGIFISDYMSTAKIAMQCVQCVVYPTAATIGLFIASRGIFLWIINISFSMLLIHLLHASIQEFGDPNDKELKWYKRMGFFRFTIPRPKLSTFAHKIRNPNDWWTFENSDTSGSSASMRTGDRGKR